MVSISFTGSDSLQGGDYLAEIGLVGKAPGKYHVYLGAAVNGSRLNVLYKPAVPTAELLPLLGPIIVVILVLTPLVYVGAWILMPKDDRA